MAKGVSYDILPRMKTIQTGTLLCTKKQLEGTNAVGIHADDEDKEFGEETLFIPEGTVCMLAEEHQFYGMAEKKPMSAWVRWRLIAGDKIIYYSLVSHTKRLWDFETYRGKQRIIQAAMEEMFEIIKQGTSEA